MKSSFPTKKYKPVNKKVKPVLGTSPEKFMIEREFLREYAHIDS